MSVAVAGGLAVLLCMGVYEARIAAERPLEWLAVLAAKGIVALGVLCAVNFVGGYVGVHLPINVFTVLLVTLFRLPGLLTVGILWFLLGGWTV